MFYELVFIARADMNADQVEKLGEKFAGIVKDRKGKVVKTEQWGLKTLAYRINKHRKGWYVMLGLQSDGATLKEISRQMNISDDIIRHMAIKVDALSSEPSVQMLPKNRNFDRWGDEDSPRRPSGRPGLNREPREPREPRENSDDSSDNASA